jgi:hypothetical protein
MGYAGGERRRSGTIRAIRGRKTKKQNEGKVMNNKFDELAKGLAQSVTRRQSLKKFGFGLVGMALACFGLAPKAEAGTCLPVGSHCGSDKQCCSGHCSAGGHQPEPFFPSHTCIIL